jgi:hypothetical protein
MTLMSWEAGRQPNRLTNRPFVLQIEIGSRLFRLVPRPEPRTLRACRSLLRRHRSADHLLVHRDGALGSAIKSLAGFTTHENAVSRPFCRPFHRPLYDGARRLATQGAGASGRAPGNLHPRVVGGEDCRPMPRWDRGRPSGHACDARPDTACVNPERRHADEARLGLVTLRGHPVNGHRRRHRWLRPADQQLFRFSHCQFVLCTYANGRKNLRPHRFQAPRPRMSAWAIK